MHSLNLIPLITLPTRAPPDSNSQPSLIDHIWTNIPPPAKAFVFNVAITDHFITAAIFPFVTDEKAITFKFRNFSQKKVDNFLNNLPNLSQRFDNIITSEVDQAHVNFNNLLEEILNEHFPICQKNIGKKRLSSPWLTKPIMQCIDKKHRLFKLFKNGYIDRAYFNLNKNKLRKVLICAKQNYFNMCFIEVKNNIKKLGA